MAKPFAHFDLSLRLEGLPPFEELTCLDLGCGAYNSDVARHVLEIPWLYLTSVDGYQPDLDAAAEKPCAAAEWDLKKMDVRTYGHGEQVDVVLAFDVLEHLPKEDGKEWLKKLERFARRRIVLFFPVEPDDFHRGWDADDNKLQEHLSHWKAHELQQLGYKVEEIFGCHTETREDGTRVRFGAVWAVKDLV
jgi:hypothetical protein